MKAILWSATLALFTACASQSKYEAKLDSWIGHSEEELIDSYGVPKSTYQLSNGAKTLQFRDRGTAKIGGKKIGPTEIENGGTTWCETTFKIDANGKVASYKFDGNACRSR